MRGDQEHSGSLLSDISIEELTKTHQLLQRLQLLADQPLNRLHRSIGNLCADPELGAVSGPQRSLQLLPVVQFIDETKDPVFAGFSACIDNPTAPPAGDGRGLIAAARTR